MATSTPSTPVPSGRIIAQQEGTGQDSTGKYVAGMNVTAQIDGIGTAFTVFIPQGQYTPEAVKAAVEERAAQVAAVHGLRFGG